jgi:hypothetical protein
MIGPPAADRIDRSIMERLWTFKEGKRIFRALGSHKGVEQCRIIQLPKVADPRGNLSLIEGGRHVI